MSARLDAPELLSPRARRLILFIAFASCAGLLGTMLYGKKLLAPQAGQHDSFGAGPLGHRAFAETMLRLEYYVAQNRGSRFETQSPLLFLEPEVTGRSGGFEHELQDALETRRSASLPTLVALPKWDLLPSTSGLPLLTPSSSASSVLFALGLAGALTQSTREGPRRLEGTLGSFEVEVPSLQVFTQIGAYDEVLLEDPEGAVVVRTEGGIIVVSDPDLFHNFTFHRLDHALLAMAVLGTLGTDDTLVIDETFHGHGHQFSLGEALSEFPAVLLVVHGLLVMLLVVLLGATRFGPPIRTRPPPHGPREAIEVSASVLANGQSFRRVCQEYVQEILTDLHVRLGLPETAPVRDRPAQIDRVAAHRGLEPRAERLVARAANLPGKADATGWALVREAHAFRQELLVPASAAPTNSPENTSRAPAPHRAA